jgi:hypothetical protein
VGSAFANVALAFAVLDLTGSKGLAAVFVGAMRIPSSLRLEASSLARELAEGWREVATRRWLWVIILQFGVVNAIEQGSQSVLGPAIAKDHLHGRRGGGSC